VMPRRLPTQMVFWAPSPHALPLNPNQHMHGNSFSYSERGPLAVCISVALA
jgi:hypothetical protein